MPAVIFGNIFETRISFADCKEHLLCVIGLFSSGDVRGLGRQGFPQGSVMKISFQFPQKSAIRLRGQRKNKGGRGPTASAALRFPSLVLIGFYVQTTSTPGRSFAPAGTIIYLTLQAGAP